jgi:hypothetical protein
MLRRGDSDRKRKPKRIKGDRKHWRGALILRFPVLLSILMLGVLGLALILTQYAFDLRRANEEELRVEAFLSEWPKDVTSIDRSVRALPGVLGVEFIDKTRAKEIFLSHYPDHEGLFALFEEIPLPESFRIQAEPYWLRAGLLEYLILRTDGIRGIDETFLSEHDLSRLDRVAGALVPLDLGLFVVIGLALAYLGSSFRSQTDRGTLSMRDILLYLVWVSAGAVLLVTIIAFTLDLSLELSPFRFYLILPLLPVVALVTVPFGLMSKGTRS